MVSEKKAALDVITSRMKSLNQFTLYLCDNKILAQKKSDLWISQKSV